MRAARWLETAAVAGVAATALAFHLQWSARYGFPPHADHGFHLAESAFYYAFLRAPGGPLEKGLILGCWPGPYPPLVYLTSAAWYHAVGTGLREAVASLGLYLVPLVVGAHLLGRRVAGPVGGLAAASLAVADPALLRSSHGYFLDMPLAAWTVFALAALVSSQGFSRRGWSVVTGASLGLGTLTKFTLPWYLGVPLLVWGGLALWRSSFEQFRRSLGFLGAGGLVFFGLALWCRAGEVLPVGTLISPASALVVVGWLVTCLLLWWGGRRWLEGPARNFCQALFLAGGVAGPWLLVNQPTLHIRWLPAQAAIGNNLAELHHTLKLLCQHLPLPVLAMFPLGAVALLFPGRRELLPVLTALLVGALCTLVVLPPAGRYWAPFTALMAVVGLAWMPRHPVFSVPLMILAGLVAGLHLGFPFLPHSSRLYHLAVGLGRYTRLSVIGGTPVYSWRPGLPDAWRVLAALHPGTTSLDVVGVEEDSNAPADLSYLLVAGSHWQGRALKVRVLLKEPGGDVRLFPLNPWAADRLRTLARWQGVPREPFLSPTRPDRPLPDEVLVLWRYPPPAPLLRRWYRAPYQEREAGLEWGVLFERADAGGARRAPTPPS